MARKAFVVTDAMRKRVQSLAGVGVRQEDICAIIGCRDPKTLRKHFRDELDRGLRMWRSPALYSLKRRMAMYWRRYSG